MGHFQNNKNRVQAELDARKEVEAKSAKPKREPQPPTPGARPEHMTPMQRHRFEHAPKGAHGAAPAPTKQPTGRHGARKGASEVETALLDAIEGLHGIKLEEKIQRKKAFVEQFREPAENLLAAGARNDLFSAWIVWLFDVGRIEEFIAQAPRAIALGWLTTPLGLKRDLETFFYDAVLEWSQAELSAGHSPEPYFSQVYSHHGKMLEVVAAKYHKLAGDLALRLAEQAESAPGRKSILQKALGLFGLAQQTYDKAGAKTRIAETAKALEKLEEVDPLPPAAAGPGTKESPGGEPPKDI